MVESIDEKIAAERALVIRCIDSGASGEQDYHEWRVDKLVAIRDSRDAGAMFEAARAHLRCCTRVHAYAKHAADADAVALALVDVERAQADVDRLCQP